MNEASGVVASRVYSGIYWMHSDYTEETDRFAIYAVNSNAATVKQFHVQGAGHWNWEDIAIDGSNNLWICDIGDNSRVRTSYVLYKVPEPNPYGSSSTVYVSASYRFTLPDGAKDMDSCFVWQGVPYLIHKGVGARLYRLPYLDSSKTVMAEALAYWGEDSYIGGADISKDGRRLAMIGDTSDNQWIIERSASSTNVKDFFTSPTREWKIHFYNSVGGGIAFVNGKYDFVVSSETGGFWLVKQSMYDSGGSTPPPPPTGKSYRLTFDGYDYDNANEATISVNSKVVASLPTAYTSSNNNLWAIFSLDITSVVISGTDTLTFKQNIYSSCVKNVKIVETTGGTTIFSDSTQKCLTAGGSLPSTTYTFRVS